LLYAQGFGRGRRHLLLQAQRFRLSRFPLQAKRLGFSCFLLQAHGFGGFFPPLRFACLDERRDGADEQPGSAALLEVTDLGGQRLALLEGLKGAAERLARRPLGFAPLRAVPLQRAGHGAADHEGGGVLRCPHVLAEDAKVPHGLAELADGLLLVLTVRPQELDELCVEAPRHAFQAGRGGVAAGVRGAPQALERRHQAQERVRLL